MSHVISHAYYVCRQLSSWQLFIITWRLEESSCWGTSFLFRSSERFSRWQWVWTWGSPLSVSLKDSAAVNLLGRADPPWPRASRTWRTVRENRENPGRTMTSRRPGTWNLTRSSHSTDGYCCCSSRALIRQRNVQNRACTQTSQLTLSVQSMCSRQKTMQDALFNLITEGLTN